MQPTSPPLLRLSRALSAAAVLHARHGDEALLASFAVGPARRAAVRYRMVGDDLRLDGVLRGPVDLDDVPRTIGAANARNATASGALLALHVALRGREAHVAFSGAIPDAMVLPAPWLTAVCQRTAEEVADLLRWSQGSTKSAALG